MTDESQDRLYQEAMFWRHVGLGAVVLFIAMLVITLIFSAVWRSADNTERTRHWTKIEAQEEANHILILHTHETTTPTPEVCAKCHPMPIIISRPRPPK